jgi:hypothetical protein
MEVSTFLHFPINYIFREISTLSPRRHATDKPLMDIPKASVQETPTPELTTARTCQISSSQRKAEVLGLHKILRKMTNVPGLPSKNWPKSSTRVQQWDPPSSGLPTCANTR